MDSEEDFRTELILSKLKSISQRLNNLADELYTVIGVLEHERKVKQEQKEQKYD